MFKKSLLALALAGVATTATAVEINGSTKKVSVEGMAAETSAVYADANNIFIKLNAKYALDDTITFTISGSELAEKTYELVEVGSDGTTAVTSGKSAEFGYLNSGTDSVSFRVTSTTGDFAASTVGKFYQLRGTASDAIEGGNSSPTLVRVSVADLADEATATITAVANTRSGLVIDSAPAGAKDSVTVFTGETQFDVVPTPSDATVDVAKLRKGFTSSSGKESVVAPSWSFKDNSAAGWVGRLGNTGTELKLEGDFTGVSSLLLNDDAKKSLTVKDNVATYSKADAAFAAGNITFKLPADDKRVALTAPQTFKLTATLKDGTTSVKLVDNAVVSTWKLNGDSEFVEIMPFADTYSRYIAVTNNGTVEGEIMVELFSGGKMIAAKTVGTAGKYAVTDVTAAVDALAKENEVTGVAGVRVTTNAPEANIEVSAIYYNKDVQDHVKVN